METSLQFWYVKLAWCTQMQTRTHRCDVVQRWEQWHTALISHPAAKMRLRNCFDTLLTITTPLEWQDSVENNFTATLTRTHCWHRAIHTFTITTTTNTHRPMWEVGTVESEYIFGNVICFSQISMLNNKWHRARSHLSKKDPTKRANEGKCRITLIQWTHNHYWNG